MKISQTISHFPKRKVTANFCAPNCNFGGWVLQFWHPGGPFRPSFGIIGDVLGTMGSLAPTFSSRGAKTFTPSRLSTPLGPKITLSNYFAKKHADATPLPATWILDMLLIGVGALDLRCARTGAVGSHFSFQVLHTKICVLFRAFCIILKRVWNIVWKMSFMISFVLGHSFKGVKWRLVGSSSRGES